MYEGESEVMVDVWMLFRVGEQLAKNDGFCSRLRCCRQQQILLMHAHIHMCQGYPALSIAAIKGRAEIVPLLLDAGADVDLQHEEVQITNMNFTTTLDHPNDSKFHQLKHTGNRMGTQP